MVNQKNQEDSYMKYDEVSPYQIHRIDALGSFVEVMASALPIDKAVSYTHLTLPTIA